MALACFNRTTWIGHHARLSLGIAAGYDSAFKKHWGVLKKAHLRRCSVSSGPHLPGVNSGPRLGRALHLGLFQHAHWRIERARPAVAATDGEQPSGITAGADTVGAAAR